MARRHGRGRVQCECRVARKGSAAPDLFKVGRDLGRGIGKRHVLRWRKPQGMAERRLFAQHRKRRPVATKAGQQRFAGIGISRELRGHIARIVDAKHQRAVALQQQLEAAAIGNARRVLENQIGKIEITGDARERRVHVRSDRARSAVKLDADVLQQRRMPAAQLCQGLAQQPKRARHDSPAGAYINDAPGSACVAASGRSRAGLIQIARQYSKRNGGLPIGFEPLRPSVGIPALHQHEVMRRYRDQSRSRGGGAALDEARDEPAQAPFPAARRGRGAAIDRVMQIDHVGNFEPAPPWDPHEKKRKLRRRKVDKIEPARGQQFAAGKIQRHQRTQADIADAEKAEKCGCALRHSIHLRGRRKKFRAVGVVAGRRLIADAGAQNLDLPSGFGQLPRKLPRALHVGDHGRRIGAGHQENAPGRAGLGVAHEWVVRDMARVSRNASWIFCNRTGSCRSQQNVCSAACNDAALARAMPSGESMSVRSACASDAGFPAHKASRRRLPAWPLPVDRRCRWRRRRDRRAGSAGFCWSRSVRGCGSKAARRQSRYRARQGGTASSSFGTSGCKNTRSCQRAGVCDLIHSFMPGAARPRKWISTSRSKSGSAAIRSSSPRPGPSVCENQ